MITRDELKEALQPVAEGLLAIAKAIEEATGPKTVHTSSNATAPKPSGKESEVVVGDIVTDCEGWGHVEMPFSKQKGKPLSLLPVGFVGWLADNWTPKGNYASNAALQACIDAVKKAEWTKEKRDAPTSTRKEPPTEDQVANVTGEFDHDDIPF